MEASDRGALLAPWQRLEQDGGRCHLAPTEWRLASRSTRFPPCLIGALYCKSECAASTEIPKTHVPDGMMTHTGPGCVIETH